MYLIIFRLFLFAKIQYNPNSTTEGESQEFATNRFKGHLLSKGVGADQPGTFPPREHQIDAVELVRVHVRVDVGGPGETTGGWPGGGRAVDHQ